MERITEKRNSRLLIAGFFEGEREKTDENSVAI